MAKKKEVVITCNATNVKAVIEGLERGMAALAAEEEKLLNVIKQRGYAENDEKKRLKELEKAMDAMRTNVQKNRDETKKLEAVMKDLSGSTLKDLKKALQEGKNALNNMSERDPKRKQLVDDLKRIQAQIDKNTGATNKLTGAQKGFSSAIASTAKNLATYMIGFAGFNKVKGLVEEVFRSNLKLSDSLANIRKVSGLSSEAINELYRNISKIDSRNTIETLNQLAYTGAKLGIGQNYGVSGLTGFVKAAEQVQMALGEDMGEKALPDLSKMVEVMGLIPKYGVEQSMQKAASAIFQLGATSTATGTNIVEFSKRLYGLANVSRISTQDLLALGSASDAMGLMPEVSATAFNKLFTSIQRQHNLIEQSLGMTKGRIKELYDEGKTMDAIVEIFEKMQEKGNLNLLGNIFKDLGSDGARLVNVMATMADRADILRKHLKTSRDAFKEGEAVIGEYMIQNQTAAALVERSANLWAKAFTNPEGVDMVKEMAQAWYDLSKQMTQSEALMESLHASIGWIATGISTLIKLFPVLLRFAMVFVGTLGLRGIGLAIMNIGGLITAFRTLTKDIMLASGAAGTLNVVLRSNALFMAASAIITAITLVNDYSKAAEEAAKREAERQAKLKAAFDQSKESVENVIKPLERYKRILDEGNLSENQKLAVIKDLNRDYQEYLDYLGIEINSAEDLAKAYAKVVDIMRIKKAAEERDSFLEQKNGENRMSRIENQAKVEAAARSFGLTDVDKQFLEKNQHLGTDQLYRQLVEQKIGAKAVKQEGEDITFIYIDDKLADAGSTFGPNTKKRYKTFGSEDLYEAINEYILSFRAEQGTKKEVYDMYDAEFTWTDKNGKKRVLSEFNMDEYNDAVQKAVYKRKGSLENEKPDKDALSAAKKAQQEEKQALRKELQDAKQDSDAIISKIEEWYRLQEAVITDMQADGKLTKEQAEQVVRTLDIAKNTALRDARLAISGRDTEAWERTKQQIGNLMLDQGEWSHELLQQILDVVMGNIRANLDRIDAGGGKYGITTTSLKDAVDKNAAGNQREIARLRAKSQEEVEKILLEYHYVETAIKGFSDRLAQMGILTETAQQMADRLADAKDESTLFSMKDYDKLLQGNEQAKRDMLQAFIGTGSQKYGVNPENKEQLRSWFMEFVGQFMQNEKAFGGVEYQYQSWAKPFEKDFELWLRSSDEYLDKIQAFYFSLIKSEDEYYEAMKKAYNKQKSLFAQRWENSGRAEAYDNLLKQLDLRKREQALTGKDKGTNFVDQAGFSNLDEDPEIAASIARMQQAKEELELFRETARQKQLVGEELAAFQKNLREKEMAATEAEMAMQEQLMKSISDRISKLQEWTQPIENFGTEVGQALYDQWHNGESMTAKWQDMLKKMGLAWGQLTIKIVSELMMQRIKQNIIDKAMQADAIKHQATMSTIEQTGGQVREVVAQATGAAQVAAEQTTNAAIEGAAAAHNATMVTEDTNMAVKENAINQSRAAGKTLADTGWWGIPLVAVVTALLNALLQAALGSSSKSSEKASSSSTNAATKTKLVSGMLTYDGGNVERFAVGRGSATAHRSLLYDDGTTQVYGRKHHYLATDGRVYTATDEPAPKDGLVTTPIATTVQGQPALVAERGPEIVIGRETTRAIMLNEPELIKYLADYQHLGGSHGYATARGLAAYDSGTAVQSVAVPQQPAAPQQQSGQQSQDPELRQTITEMREVMAGVLYYLQHPVRPKIDMYHHNGEDGLFESMQKATKFMAHYNR